MSIRQKLVQFARTQRAMRELNTLSARQLADIGITREQIPAAVRGQIL
jgi:uncharacterized protein YjiS (DUF1127 family)